MKTCPSCGVRLNWREEPDRICRACNPDAYRNGVIPYPGFCRHPDRCDGCGSCPRDPTCID